MRRIVVLFVTLSCLPVSIFLLLANYFLLYLNVPWSDRRRISSTPGFRPRRILITGIDTPQGLRIARAFHETGHHVLGIGHQFGLLPIPARLSFAVHEFHSLHFTPSTYVKDLVRIIAGRGLDLWIDCGHELDPATQVEALSVIEQATPCSCFALRHHDISHFKTKEHFLTYLHSLGFPTPETHRVNSRDEVHNLMNRAQRQRRYVLYNPEKTAVNTAQGRTILPRSSLSQTYHTISQIPISQTSPFQLEQDFTELDRYKTCAIIVRGQVKAFVATTRSKHGSLRLLDSNSSLTKSMVRFVQNIANKQSRDFDSHLCIDFCAEERITPTGVEITILPIDFSTSAHVSLLGFTGLQGSVQLTNAYLAALDPAEEFDRLPSNAILFGPETPTRNSPKLPPNCTSIYNTCELVGTLLYSIMNLILFRLYASELAGIVVDTVTQMAHGSDDLYCFWDPAPFWWSYQIHTPLRGLANMLIAAE